MKKNLWILSLAFAAMMVVGVGKAQALMITRTSADGNLSASADFEVDNGNLVVTLTNVSTVDVMNPAMVLTGMFFDLVDNAGNAITLTPVSALLNTGSMVYFDPDGQPAGGNVGGEWAYATGLSGAPYGATQGISSTGLGLFGDSNFNGPDLQAPTAVDGLQYGITSAGDDTTTGNSPVTGGNNPSSAQALIKNSVVFTLSGFSLNDITFANIDPDTFSFQYGTSLTEPNLGPPVPEPATMLLLGTGLVGLAGISRRRMKKG